MKASHLLVYCYLCKSSAQGQLVPHQHVEKSQLPLLSLKYIPHSIVFLTRSCNAYISVFFISNYNQLLI